MKVNIMNELEKNVVNDYPLLGAKKCSIKYGVTYNKILWIREKYKLSVNKNVISEIRKTNTTNSWKNRITIHSVDENIFMNRFTKESVYLLGFIWGDGYISDSGTNYQIRIECLSDDIDNLKPMFDKTGVWKYYERIRINRKNKVTTALTSNKELTRFLIKNDYKIKSIASPDKIWKLIPIELQKYFILGWIDADGCFYWNEKHKLRQFCLSGSYEQYWNVFESILTLLKIKYRIMRINKKTSYSNVRITGKENILKLGNYLYSDLIPFQRKYNKYKLIVN